MGFGGDFHAFKVADVLGGLEIAVLKAFDPALFFGITDVFGVPLALFDVGEAAFVVGKEVFVGGGKDDYFGDFGAVDAVVRAESVEAGVAFDDALIGEAGDGFAVGVAVSIVESSGVGSERDGKKADCGEEFFHGNYFLRISLIFALLRVPVAKIIVVYTIAPMAMRRKTFQFWSQL